MRFKGIEPAIISSTLAETDRNTLGYPRQGPETTEDSILADSVSTDMNSVASEAELIAAVQHAKKKRLGPFSVTLIIDRSDYNRQLGSMARAGYSFDVSQRVLKMTLPEARAYLMI